MASSFNPGDRLLKRYVIEAFEARQGGAELYRARHDQLGHTVLARIRVQADPEADARLQRSADLLSRIRHPNVATLLDYGFEGGRPVIMMEYFVGQTLRQVLAARGAVPWHGAVSVMQGALAGIDAIHDAEAVHRSLNPSTIAVAPGSPPAVKLIDLGLLKSMYGGASRITRAGMAVGNPAYMAPEQLSGARVDGRADLYAIGLVLYELVTGRPARDASSVPAIMDSLRKPPPPPIAPAGMPPLPRALEGLILASLDPEPGRRPFTAADFAKQLKALEASQQAPSVRSGLSQAVPSRQPQPPSQRLRMRADSQAAVDPRKGLRQESSFVPSPLPQGGQAQPPTTSVARSYAGPAAAPSAPADEGELRVRALLAAQLPTEFIGSRDATHWLSDQIPPGQSFFVGDPFWIGLITSHDDARAQSYGRSLTDRLRQRFGPALRVRAAMVGPSFTLPQACLEGTAPPPLEVIELLEQLHKG